MIRTYLNYLGRICQVAVICSDLAALLVQYSKRKCMICIYIYYIFFGVIQWAMHGIYGLLHVALSCSHDAKLCNVRRWSTRILRRNKRRFRREIWCVQQTTKKFAGPHCDKLPPGFLSSWKRVHMKRLPVFDSSICLTSQRSLSKGNSLKIPLIQLRLLKYYVVTHADKNTIPTSQCLESLFWRCLE